MLTPEEVLRLKASYKTAIEDANDFTNIFYRYLYDVYPNLKPWFLETDQSVRRRKMVAGLNVTIAICDRSERLDFLIDGVGTRHDRHAVREDHYGPVVATFLWSLRRRLGEAWDAEIADIWTRALHLTAKQLSAAQRSSDTLTVDSQRQ